MCVCVCYFSSQRLVLRKQETADQGVEERRRLAAENLSEGRKRFTEQRKKQVRPVLKTSQGSFVDLK